MSGAVKVASTCKEEPFVGKPGRSVSSELQAAQHRLAALRAQLQTSQTNLGGQRSHSFETTQSEQRPFPTPNPIAQLPPHLGWESTAITLTLRRRHLASEAVHEPVQLESIVDSPPHPLLPKTIGVHPDVAIGLLREEQVAAGRLWLLLRAVDTNGQGWIDELAARRWFTDKRAPLRFCGVRQLRNLLARGEAIFWKRLNGRIWLRSVAKVAFTLQVPRLKMRPVAVPVRVLRQRIGRVRAHLYATFHSSRSQSNLANKPIARETVAHLTQVQPRTQRRYERMAKVKRQAQYAIGGQATTENLQARGWEQGKATFQFKDFTGKHGPQGKCYVAWQLPNSYVGPHAPQPKGCQKRINRTLTDLFMQGITGNGQRTAVARRFFDNGRLAAKAYLRNPVNDHYWRGTDNGCFGNAQHKRYQLWQVMEKCQVK